MNTFLTVVTVVVVVAVLAAALWGLVIAPVWVPRHFGRR